MNEFSSDGSRCGLLLVGHGTKNATGRDEMLLVAREVADSYACPIEPCFLELAEPNISQGVARLYERGVRQLTVVPLLLFAAGHAKRDIPEAVETAAGDFPDLRVSRYTPAFDCHERMLELSAKRFTEAVRTQPRFAAPETHLILVGRGSNDDEAIEAMRKFTRLRCDMAPVRSAETCFIAMASPSLKETIASVEEKLRSGPAWPSESTPKPPPKLIVVQPHLLFRGGLQAQVVSVVKAAAARTKDVDWLVTDHLGPDRLLIRAIVEIANATSSE